MITLDVVDLRTSSGHFVFTEQSIQPVNVKLLPQKLLGDAMSVTVVPPTDGELLESSRKLFSDYGKFPHLSVSLFQVLLLWKVRNTISIQLIMCTFAPVHPT
jgi:hypothetical protein